VPLQLEVLVRKVLAVKKAKVAEAAKAAKDTTVTAAWGGHSFRSLSVLSSACCFSVGCV
jgi:hypothetical protein